MKKDVLLIIPAYNEAMNIGELLFALKDSDCMDYCDVIVVNDASSDTTGMIAKSIGVNVVSHVFNLGYGSALQIGYKYAVRGGYKYVIQLDADGQHDISNIPNLYNALCEKDAPDIILCSRYLPGSVSFKVSKFKKIAVTYFSWLIKLTTKQIITDPTSGLQGMNRDAFLYYSRFDCFDHAYPDANMIIQTMRYGLTYKEIPCIMRERLKGVSMHSGIIKPIGYMITVTMSIIDVVIRDKIYKKRKAAADVLEKEVDRIRTGGKTNV